MKNLRQVTGPELVLNSKVLDFKCFRATMEISPRDNKPVEIILYFVEDNTTIRAIQKTLITGKVEHILIRSSGVTFYEGRVYAHSGNSEGNQDCIIMTAESEC